MTKRMLLDASHPEETRVVVLSGNRLDDFDYETKDKKPLKGNIYLAKVTRVEPSLQAAFVDYGGNRHGFLPFSEIHPDYYRLPIADREALIAEEQAAQKAEGEGELAQAGEDGEFAEAETDNGEGEDAGNGGKRSRRRARNGEGDGADDEGDGDPEVEQVETTTSVETLAGDEMEDAARRRAAILGRYKIQEVIKRRQVILVQVVKEERGNKGAALTTYLSLAGRYCVLMPNTNKGGGISRKIASAKDRRRLKGVLSELNIPEGMAVIVRTAGSNRSKAEIKRDYEYLLRLWDEIRETTLNSTAPALIYEEANLIKRAIRDLYTRDMDEVLVEGEDGYKAAKAFMKSLMPSHAKKVQKYDDAKVPLFHRHQIEAQLDNIHNPSVQLKSGGYIVINQTEALVAIDVNSGKATKERHIEETALKTNLEAADEVARQLKLRDMAGLIVIDFIDMDAAKNNREVEQRLKEAMRQDRARIQLGRISPFGLLELSRQRLRPSLHETSTEVCKTCGGSGFVRSPDSTALHVLRALEEEGIKRGGGEILLTMPTGVALYTLNDKRDRLIEIEQRYGFRVRVETDDKLVPPAYRLDRLTTVQAGTAEDVVEAESQEQPAGEDEESGRKRGKRGGRKRRKSETQEPAAEEAAAEAQPAAAESAESAESDSAGEDEDEKAKRRRRRGKRGGRRRSKRRMEEGQAGEAGAEPQAADADAQAGPETETAQEPAAEAPAETEAAAAESGDSAGSEAPAEAEPAKPARSRRRSSRRKAAAAEAPAETASAETAGAEAASAEPAADAAAEATEAESEPAEAPKAKSGGKSRSRKATTSRSGRAGKSGKGRSRKSAGESAESAEAPAQASDEAAASGPATEAAEAPEPTVSEPAAAEPAVEPVRETAAAAEPATVPATSGSAAGEETAFGEAAEPQGVDETSEAEPSKTSRPRRRGWWQKLVN